MGKYSLDTYRDHPTETVRNAILILANELAESNRLKRLELRIKSLKHDLPKTQKECEEDSA